MAVSRRARGSEGPDPHLVPRRTPQQQRARQTVDEILAAAAALIEEVGLEAFNTNALAERAGVRVRTIYRYFPNKLAVLTALAQRMAAQWDTWFDGYRAIADPEADWRVLWSDYVDTFVEGIRRTPGALAIRRAMRALPELEAIERADNERLAGQLAAALARRGSDLPRARLAIAARVLIETAVAVLDLAMIEPPARTRALVEELKQLQLAYLAAHFEAGSRAARAKPARRRSTG